MKKWVSVLTTLSMVAMMGTTALAQEVVCTTAPVSAVCEAVETGITCATNSTAAKPESTTLTRRSCKKKKHTIVRKHCSSKKPCRRHRRHH